MDSLVDGRNLDIKYSKCTITIDENEGHILKTIYIDICQPETFKTK